MATFAVVGSWKTDCVGVGHRNGHGNPGMGEVEQGKDAALRLCSKYESSQIGMLRDARGQPLCGCGPKGSRFNSCQAHQIFAGQAHVWRQPCAIRGVETHRLRQTCVTRRFAGKSVRQLSDYVTRSHDAGHHDTAVRATQSELASRWRVDELKGIDAKAPRELRATSVWGFAELDHRRTDLHPTAWRQVFAADV